MSIPRRSESLLSEIEAAALDQSSELPAVLRKCITLGGITGSERLREWAVRELKGYDSDDELPPYRQLVAPLVLDGTVGSTIIREQAVPLTMIPDFARDKITTDCRFPQPIAELADLLSSARNRGEDSVRIGVPGGRALVELVNRDLAGTNRQVERIFWSVKLSPVAGILDVVRTTLVELAAEMRARTPGEHETPSHEATEQAVDVAIVGRRNRVVINQAASDSQVATAVGGSVAVGSGTAETTARKFMWWLVGIAAVVSAVAAVWILLL